MLKISNMTGKLKGFKALNTNTLSNDYCMKMYNSGKDNVICTKCYSAEMLQGMRKNCIPAWQMNSDTLSGGLIPEHMLPTILDAFFRISGHGEIINMTMIENIHGGQSARAGFASFTARARNPRILSLSIATRALTQ